jgi:hypothetical protein
VTTAKPWLPPRRVANWKKRYVELPGALVDDLTYDAMRLWSESCIAGEETTFIAGVHQIHVCGAPPAIY